MKKNYIPVVRFVTGKRQCECGTWFDPISQGHEDDRRCMECIDKDNAPEHQKTD